MRNTRAYLRLQNQGVYMRQRCVSGWSATVSAGRAGQPRSTLGYRHSFLTAAYHGPP
jgi:hypothetical protein